MMSSISPLRPIYLRVSLEGILVPRIVGGQQRSEFFVLVLLKIYACHGAILEDEQLASIFTMEFKNVFYFPL